MTLTKLVLDVLKQLKEPTIIELAYRLLELDGIKSVDIEIKEIDVETLSLTITIEGSNIDFEKVRGTLEKLNVVVHDINKIYVSKD
uniref:DUF211 domain-containing protein n=1 Tax=Ignisphaera aggregans TaxID=334771 RepID=A0A7J3YTF1_9CREN